MTKVKQNKKQIFLNKILQNGGGLISATFTSENAVTFEGILRDVGLDSSNCSSEKSKIGTGVLTYVGYTWVGGFMFLGERAAVDPKLQDKPAMLRFSGVEGQEFLQKILGQPSSYEKLLACKVTAVDTCIQVKVPLGLSDKMLFTEHAKEFKSACDGTKNSVTLNAKGAVVIGRKSNNQCFCVEQTGNSVTCEINLGGSAATKFIVTASQSGNTFLTTAAYLMWEHFRTLPQLKFSSLLLDGLKETFKLSSVRLGDLSVVPKKTGEKPLTPEMSRVKASCTSIVNKLKTANASLDTQKVVIKHLFEAIYQARGSIQDFTAFEKAIVSALSAEKK